MRERDEKKPKYFAPEPSWIRFPCLMPCMWALKFFMATDAAVPLAAHSYNVLIMAGIKFRYSKKANKVWRHLPAAL